MRLYLSTALFIILMMDYAYTQEKLTEGYFTVVYNKSDVLADVRINGIPVITKKNTDSASGQQDINFWIFKGKNIISINLDEQKKKDESSWNNPKINIYLYIGQKGRFPDEGKLIAKFEWPEKTSGDENIKIYPVSKIIEFEPEFLPPSELWSRAEPVNITMKDEGDIIRLLEDFEKAFNSRNTEKLFQLSEFRGLDTSRARYFPLNKEKMMMEIKAFNSNKTLKIKNITDGKYKFIKLFSGQIYQVTGAADQAPLIFESNDGSGDVDIYVSKIDNKWTLSR